MRNIPLFKPFIPPREELMPALEETLYSGYIAQGEKVKEFEKKFGEYIGNPNVVAVSSCTAALHLALILAGVGPGDEVISTPMTAEPTNMAILYTGAKIVWADVDPLTGNIDWKSIRRLMNDKVKAIMVVHYMGTPAEIHKIRECAYWYRIPVIEDCAHALGAAITTRFGPLRLGHTGTQFACFSFQAIKHMTTVEGGALIVDEPRLLEKARRIRWFGIDRELIRTEVNIDEKGYKYNPNEVMAAMGLIQLKHIDWIVEKHMVNADWFESHLDETVGLPKATADRSSYWTYTIFSDHRDKIEAHLKTNGIGCGTVHRPNIYHIIFRNRFEIEPHEHLFLGDSGLSKFHNTALHIPCGWWVTPDDREYIAEKIEEALA